MSSLVGDHSWFGFPGRRRSGGVVTGNKGFAQAAQENGPEPAEEQRSRQAADGAVEENPIGRAIREPARPGRQDKSAGTSE
jgi:hypothetical protein